MPKKRKKIKKKEPIETIPLDSGFLFICNASIGESIIGRIRIFNPNGLTYKSVIGCFFESMLTHLIDVCEDKKEAFEIIDSGITEFRQRPESYKLKHEWVE